MSPTLSTSRPAPPRLAEHAKEVTALLRSAWRELLTEGNNGRAFTRATQIARALEVRPKLAWQVWRVMNATDPFEALEHMPGPGGIDSVIKAARSLGASHEAEDQLRVALRELASLVQCHAGDRQTLAIMLAQSSPAPNEDADEEHRRHGFLSSSYLWGVQARVYLMLSIIHPGASGKTVDAVAIRGLIGLRRLRPNVPWVVARIGCYPDPGENRFGPYREPLTLRGESSESPVLAAFSTPGDLPIRTVPVSPTLVDVELGPGPVGDTGVVTCITGEVFRNLPKYRSPEFPRATIAPLMLTPCQLLVHDILVHDGVGDIGAFETSVYGDMRGEGFNDLHERNVLPVRAQMQPLPMASLASPRLPQYPGLIESVLDRLGWPSSGFRAFRLSLRFPVVPSTVATSFELPADRSEA